MGKVNIDFTPTKYNADDAPDLVTGAYNQSMDDLKTALDNATAEDGGGGGDITYPIPIANGGTGANNARDAANNLEVYYLGVREPIPTNADLDNYKTVGSYASPTNAMAATVLNAPMDAPMAFTLTVEKSISNENTYNFFRQIFHDRVGKIYTRFIEGDTWSDWVKIAAETDLANYLPLTGGTLTGNLDINNQENVLGRIFLSATEFQFSLLNKSDSTQINSMALTENQSYFKVPVSVSSGGTGAKTAEQARENLGIVDPTPVYVETEETSEPGLHIIVDSENNVLKIKKV